MTRITSYSVRNSLDTIARPAAPLANRVTIKSLSAAATSSIGRIPATLGRTGSAASALSARLLSASVNGADPADARTSFAAFKVLPIDPARTRRASSVGGDGAYVDTAEELSGAGSCREAVDLMVDSIRRACEDMGNDGRVVDGTATLVAEEDVVGCVVVVSRLMTLTDKLLY
jgi:hypothetical protein